MRAFRQGFKLSDAIDLTRERGYAFFAGAADPALLAALKEELERLPLEFGDHERYPINKGAPNEVRQRHERCYRPLGHADVPAATALCRALAALAAGHRELDGWLPDEIGYQRYRGADDRISPHRDRASDRLFSLTFTIAGSAWVRIHEPETEPPDYARLRLVDSFLTAPGTVMCLRAPGFGGGEQVIHEVLPPVAAPREILNLRMRPTVLKPPAETRWRGPR